MVSLRGRLHSITSPEICVEPSVARTMNAPPIVSSSSTAKPEKYFRENSAEVNAVQTCSAVALI
jgi:hypothetical protein